jgi:hypothetical protein
MDGSARTSPGAPGMIIPGGQALDGARNTVVAAVDGLGGNSEGDFLAEAFRLRGNLHAYDLVLKQQVLGPMLSKRNVPLESVTLTVGSVTMFGEKVPKTELLIPHPGPWAYDQTSTGLGACIGYVLGPDSKAYVLTDNESSQDGQSAALVQKLQSLNEANAGKTGYTALSWQVDVVKAESKLVDEQLARKADFTVIGGASLQLRHDPPWRLVTITRA